MNPFVAGMIYPPGGISKDLVKEILMELLQEAPELFSNRLENISELSERIELTQIEQARDRSRITDLELLLGLDEVIQYPEDPFYPEKKERLKELQERSGFLNDCQKEENQLYKELQRRGFMKTRDVMNYLGLKHYEQARRVMKQLSNDHKDVVLDPNEQGKGYRIRFLQ